MTETQQRFLRAIADRVPREHVVEVHLFPPIRQGGVETGVAVVAEDPRRPPVSVENVSPNGEHPMSATSPEAIQVDAVFDEVMSGLPADDARRALVESAEAVAPALTDSVNEGLAAEEAAARKIPDEEIPAEPTLAGNSQAEEAPSNDAPVEAANGRTAHQPRFTIHTARYRLTLKGVDRGKWDFDVVAEADAPLDAVDAVVRGVQRRAGEGAEPDRLTTEAFLDALATPLAQLER